MTSAHVAAQLRAQGIDPKTMQATGKPKNSLTVNPRTPEPTTTPAEGPALNTGKKTRQKHTLTPTDLKPRYQVATTKGYPGARMVFTGLTDDQVQHLATAARVAGILEQN